MSDSSRLTLLYRNPRRQIAMGLRRGVLERAQERTRSLRIWRRCLMRVSRRVRVRSLRLGMEPPSFPMLVLGNIVFTEGS